MFDIRHGLVIVMVEGRDRVSGGGGFNGDHAMTGFSDPPNPLFNPEFAPLNDNESRRLIRDKLLHYMRSHDMGVPTLAKRIKNAHPRKLEIPIKTLQRFLADTHRTNDLHVALCSDFVEGLPCPDPIGALGKALAEFYASQGADRYAGNFVLTVSYKISGKRSRLNSGLEITADEGFCRVAEWSEQRRFLSCEGVLVCDGQTAIVTLNDKLTYRAKQFLMIADGKKISGRGTVVDFEPSVARDRLPSLLFISLSMIEQPLICTPAIDSARY